MTFKQFLKGPSAFWVLSSCQFFSPFVYLLRMGGGREVGKGVGEEGGGGGGGEWGGGGGVLYLYYFKISEYLLYTRNLSINSSFCSLKISIVIPNAEKEQRINKTNLSKCTWLDSNEGSRNQYLYPEILN